MNNSTTVGVLARHGDESTHAMLDTHVTFCVAHTRAPASLWVVFLSRTKFFHFQRHFFPVTAYPGSEHKNQKAFQSCQSTRSSQTEIRGRSRRPEQVPNQVKSGQASKQHGTKAPMVLMKLNNGEICPRLCLPSLPLSSFPTFTIPKITIFRCAWVSVCLLIMSR